MIPHRSSWLIRTWDEGFGRNPLGRALSMVECALPEASSADIAALSIADRDRELLRIRSRAFGDAMRGYLPCVSCGERLEFETSVSSLLNRLNEEQTRQHGAWRTGNFLFSMRMANSADLAAATTAADSRAARKIVIRGCTTVQQVAPACDELEPEDWEFQPTTIEKFEALHRDTELIFTLVCPSCGERQKSELDVAGFFWSELCAAALGVLREVHELARAYGWSEAAILQMTDARRNAYLEMAHS